MNRIACPRVLVVDDDVETLRSLAVLLNAEGYAVTTVDSGRKALESCRTSRFDCLLLDVTLGDTSGLAVARILAQNPQIRPRHVVLISGHSRDEFLHELRDGLVDGYVPKPAELDELVAAVRKALAQDRALH